jgi:hypothetical protein
MGKASIYRGFQSTQTQGGLKENLILNRLKIVTLVMGFDTDQHFLKQRTLLGWGSGLDYHGATRQAHGLPRLRVGWRQLWPAWLDSRSSRDSSQGKKKRKILFDFQIPF